MSITLDRKIHTVDGAATRSASGAAEMWQRATVGRDGTPAGR